MTVMTSGSIIGEKFCPMKFYDVHLNIYIFLLSGKTKIISNPSIGTGVIRKRKLLHVLIKPLVYWWAMVIGYFCSMTIPTTQPLLGTAIK